MKKFAKVLAYVAGTLCAFFALIALTDSEYGIGVFFALIAALMFFIGRSYGKKNKQQTRRQERHEEQPQKTSSIESSEYNEPAQIPTQHFNLMLSQLDEFPVAINEDAERAPRVVGSREFKTYTITSKTPDKFVSEYFVVDVETTGLNVGSAEIVQLCAIHFIDFRPADCFCTYVKPRRGIKYEAERINGIHAETVADAPYIEQVMESFDAYLGEKPTIVGHNIPFDLKFLYAFGSQSILTGGRIYDTLPLAKRAWSSYNYKLDTLCSTALNVSRSDAHDAKSDCLATGLLFEKECILLR